MSPRQPVSHFAMPSPRDQFPPGMLPPLEHYQQAGLPRRGSFTGQAPDVFQSSREAFGTSFGGCMSPRDPLPGAMPVHQVGLGSPRGFSSFQRPSVDGAQPGGGDVDMLSGSKLGAGGVSSAFAAPAGQAMAGQAMPPALPGRQPQQAGLGAHMSQQHGTGSGGLEGMQRFTRLVDNVMGGSGGVGGSGSSNQTAECGASHPSPGVPTPGANELSNGSAGPQPLQQQSQQSDSHSRQTHSAGPAASGGQPTSTATGGQPASTGGSPVGDFGQADMEDATVKKRKYRRSTERRQTVDQSGALRHGPL